MLSAPALTHFCPWERSWIIRLVSLGERIEPAQLGSTLCLSDLSTCTWGESWSCGKLKITAAVQLCLEVSRYIYNQAHLTIDPKPCLQSAPSAMDLALQFPPNSFLCLISFLIPNTEGEKKVVFLALRKMLVVITKSRKTVTTWFPAFAFIRLKGYSN